MTHEERRDLLAQIAERLEARAATNDRVREKLLAWGEKDAAWTHEEAARLRKESE